MSNENSPSHEDVDMAGVPEDIDFAQPLRGITREQAMAILARPAIDSTGHQVREFAQLGHYQESKPGLRDAMVKNSLSFDGLLYRILEMRKAEGGGKPMTFGEIGKELGLRETDVRNLYDKAASKIVMFGNTFHFDEQRRRETDI